MSKTHDNISVSTTTTSSVLANGVLPLSNIVRRYGDSLNSSANSITIRESGYYLVNVTTTFNAPAAGAISIALQDDGVNVVGGNASTTITTANTEVRSLSFSAIVRAFCGNLPDSLTIVNNGLAANYTNINVNVVKL